MCYQGNINRNAYDIPGSSNSNVALVMLFGAVIICQRDLKSHGFLICFETNVFELTPGI